MAVCTSVIIPFYKTQAQLFFRCLDSLSKQSMSACEFILVSDGSKDPDALEMVKAKILKDSRFRLIELERNSGVSVARNAGLAAASGKYVAFVDADDFVEPDMVERMFQTAERNSSDLVICNFTRVNEAGERVADRHIDSLNFPATTIPNNDLNQASVYACMQWSVWNKLFLRSRLHHSFQPGLKIAEDKLFSVQALLGAERISFLPDRFYHYVCNADSVMQNMDDEFMPLTGQLLQAHRQLLQIAEEWHIGPETMRRIALDLLRSLIVDIVEKSYGSRQKELKMALDSFLNENRNQLLQNGPLLLQWWFRFYSVLPLTLFRKTTLLWRFIIRVENRKLDKRNPL